MERVLCLLSKLRRVEFKVCCYWEYFCFCVEVGGVGVECATGYCTQGCILGGLEFGDVGVRGDGGPDCAGVF